MNPRLPLIMNEAWYQTAFGAHYSLLYAHRDEDEARRCLDLLPRLAPLTPPDRQLPVLDLGCGDGRHLEYLAQGCGRVLGLDLSASLLNSARRQGRNRVPGVWGLVRGDMRRIPVATGAVGGVLSLFTAFGYFGNLNDNLVVVKEVSRVLAVGGHWFLDYLDCRRVRAELEPFPRGRRRTRTLGPCRITEIRRLGDGGAVVLKDVEVKAVPGREEQAAEFGIGSVGLSYTEQVALFEVPELDVMAAELGLHRCAAVGGYGGEALGEGDRWLLVYRRERRQGAGHD